MTQCQICKSTKIKVGWFCPTCDQPLCLACSTAITDAGYKLKCFNVFCPEALKYPEMIKIVDTSGLRGKWERGMMEGLDKWRQGVMDALGLNKRS